MKPSICLMLACLVLVCTFIAPAQKAADPNKLSMYYTKTLKSGAAYVLSQIDTSGVLNLGGASRVSLVTTVNDSASYITFIDYRKTVSAAWVATVSDTVAVVAGGAASVRSWVLRDATTEKVAGVGGQWRFRQAFAATDNGVTTPTYTQTVCFTP